MSSTSWYSVSTIVTRVQNDEPLPSAALCSTAANIPAFARYARQQQFYRVGM